MTQTLRQAWLWCAALCCACSVDPSTHPRYRKGDTCRSDKYKYEIFCLPKRDAGKPTPDAGDEMPHASPDSGPDIPPESCTPDTESTCYPSTELATSRQPPCRAGTHKCGKDGLWGECMGATLPATELCDGMDNDCDGATDEGQLQKSCELSGGLQGECAKNGLAFCSDGEETCLPRNTPKPETCDDKDNDCDGETDEGLDVACYTAGVGCTANNTQSFDCVSASSCAPGKLRCIGGVMQTECSDQVGPQDERATQQSETPLDEDCDGTIDEGFSCQSGQEFPCYTGLADTRGHSPCKDGKVTCNSNGEFGQCMNQRTPEPETCANPNLDDDCDGTKDDVPGIGTSCSDMSPADGVCKKIAIFQCQGGSKVCKSGDPTGRLEVCNGDGEDEDCDSKVDEGFDLQTDENNCGSCKNRCTAGLTCCAGSCVNTNSSNNSCGSCANKCDSGLTCCSASCVNTNTSATNCGTCGKGCLLGCSNGGCNLL
jgi:hypothetical protein